MQITKVSLRNIKNHAEAEWRFQPGVIAICGPNGAGKTTIIEAIAWALFDHLDYKRDDFLKRGEKRGEVGVSFISDLDDREYAVHRDTGGGYYVFDPQTKMRLIEQKNQVVPWLRQHIGVEPGTDLSDLFKTTVGVPQGTFTTDFILPLAHRKATFDRILKVEEYRRASDHLRDTLRYLEGRINEAERKLAEAEGELKSYDEVKREHDEAATRLTALEGEQATVVAARDLAATEVAQLDELRRQIEAQRGQIERLRVRVEITRGTLGSAREAAAQARAAASIVAAARAGYDEYVAATQRLTELDRQRAARDELRAQATNVERTSLEARNQVARLQERLTEATAARTEVVELAAKIEAQAGHERRLAELREGRGELQSLQRSLTALDADLEKMRQRYAQLSRQLETAEAQRQKAESIAALDQQRAQLDAEIARLELALKSRQMQLEHLENMRRERTRLAAEHKRKADELARLEPLTAAAAQLVESETQQHGRTEELAQLRAEVARDEEMITSLAGGGICPLLTEKCLNLKPGESLDGRFRAGLETRRTRIGELQQSLTALTRQVKRARAASAETAQLSELRAEAARLHEELAARAGQMAQAEAELALSNTITAAELQARKTDRAKLDKSLREAREAERLFHQAEVLRGELHDLSQQGKTKRGEREELVARIAKLGDIEQQLAAGEAALRALGDPRGRATALEQLIAREPEWRRETESAEARSRQVVAELTRLNAELQTYAALTADLAAVAETRARAERDYYAFISHQQIAATVAAREQEVAVVAAEIEQSETAFNAAQESLRELAARYDADAHRRRQNELDQWRKRDTQIAAQIEHTRERHTRLQSQLAHLDGVRARLREQIAAKEQAQRLRETADFIRDILLKAAPYITESYLYSVSIEANQLFREITGRHDMTLRWTKDYEITLEEDGFDRPFVSLSGGEQMAAALAVRLALLKELSEVNLAFFDEPTANMDEERRRNLAQQIGRIKDFKQLFVISHDDTFEGYTNQTVALGARE